MTTQTFDEARAPVVFVSYSHDSPEHKRWVAEIATRLRRNGVDVILDQWDLRRGDDLVRFMEQSVREADRVLMICTNDYVRKANDGKGGVGYEAMIVSGELIRDQGKAKFIPIVRQNVEEPVLPASVSTRFYVDLSNSELFDSEFEELLRELHEAPLTQKPALGTNPFVSETNTPASMQQDGLAGAQGEIQALRAPSETYASAIEIVKQNDWPRWRNVVRLAREEAIASLATWWDQHGGVAPKSTNELVDQSLIGLGAFEHLIALALGAVSTGRKNFNNQVALFDEVVMPKGWHRGGFVVRTNLPDAGGFAYQAIHGALCLHTGQLNTAMRLANEEILRFDADSPRPIFRIPSFVGWPDALGVDSINAWKQLLSLPKRWPWLLDAFGDIDDFERALVAYYMALNLNEYASTIAGPEQDGFDTPHNVRLETPTHFMAVEDDVRRAAYRLLTADACTVCDIWRSRGVSDELAKEQWPAWLKVCGYWHTRIYSINPFSHSINLIEQCIRTCRE